MSTTALTKVGTKNAEQVVLLDGSGNQITSFGGGTQYADGASAATPTGTQINWNDGGVQRAVSAAKPLPVTASIDTTGLATSAKQDTGNTSIASIDTKTPALGQALAAASVPVVLTAAQVSTLTPPAAITGFATEATLATRLTESDFDTKTGSLTEAAPATDTASSGLNGRLQRIAQRLTSLITALGSPFQAGGSIGNTSFGATQSGTWTVQPGNTANTTPWLASIHDGTAKATVRDLAANDALNVAIVDGSGDQITSFGGGTQYTEGDTDSTITGTAMMWEDTADTLRPVSSANPLPISVATIPSHNVTNAGTFATQATLQAGTAEIGKLAAGTAEIGNVKNSGTFATQVNGSALTALQLIDDPVFTDGDPSSTPKFFAVGGFDGAAMQVLATDGNGYAKVDLSGTGANSTAIKVNVASGGIASGALASGSIAAGAVAAGATSFVKLEDVASADADAGVPSMAVRKATPANTSGTDGDYEMLQMSAGRLWTSATIDAALPTGANTIGALTANQSVNVSQMNGVATTMGNGVSGTGVQRVSIASDSTGNIATIGTSVTPGTGASNLGKAEDAGHTSADVGVFALAVRNDTTTQTNLTSATLDYSGFAVDIKGNAMNVGNVAHDEVDAGHPQKVGGKAYTANPTAVASGDRSDFITDKLGKQVVVDAIRDLKGIQQTTITSSTSETTIVTAAASTFHDVYSIVITNTSATGTKVTIKDSTAGTTRMVIYVPATETRGFALTPSAAMPQATVNTNWTATCGTSVSAIEITALYVKNI